MNNKEILANAPEGATHYGSEGDYYRQPKDRGGYWGLHKKEWSRLSALLDEVRSLEDIKLIVELEEIAKAVAHIGVDFGYGKYELQPEIIDKARELLSGGDL